MKAYLTPFKMQKEAHKTQSNNEKKSFNAYRDRVKNWRAEYREKVEGRALSDDDEDDSEGDLSGEELPDEVVEQKKNESSSEEEFKADVDFIDPNDIIVRHDDLDQVLKGYRIDRVGDTKALSKKLQRAIKKRENIEADD